MVILCVFVFVSPVCNYIVLHWDYRHRNMQFHKLLVAVCSLKQLTVWLYVYICWQTVMCVRPASLFVWGHISVIISSTSHFTNHSTIWLIQPWVVYPSHQISCQVSSATQDYSVKPHRLHIIYYYVLKGEIDLLWWGSFSVVIIFSV